MCFNNGSSTPTPQAAAPAPTRAGVTAATDSAALDATRKTIQKRMGVFGNVRTSPLGDSTYGTFARFGSAGARTE